MFYPAAAVSCLEICVAGSIFLIEVLKVSLLIPNSHLLLGYLATI